MAARSSILGRSRIAPADTTSGKLFGKDVARFSQIGWFVAALHQSRCIRDWSACGGCREAADCRQLSREIGSKYGCWRWLIATRP